jgi:hypothetical protein
MPDENPDPGGSGADAEGRRQDRALRWPSAARFPAFKVRGQWRFKRDDLDQWIDQQKLCRRDHDKT